MYGANYYGSAYYGEAYPVYIASYTLSHTSSVALKSTLTKSHSSSIAPKGTIAKSHTSSIRLVVRLAISHTSSLAAQKQYSKSHTGSVRLVKRLTVSHTSSVRLIEQGILQHTSSINLLLQKFDYETVPVGGLRLVLISAAGVTLGPVFTSTRATVHSVLDQIGSISFSVPATDPMTTNLAQGVHVKAYHRTLGYVGEFIIRDRRLSVSQATLDIDGWSLLQELVFYNTYLGRKYNNIAVSTVLSVNNISGNLYGLLYGTGWDQGTIDGGLGNIVVSFEGQSIFEAIDAIAKRLKKHFREGTTARTLDFGAMGTDAGYRLIKPQLATTDLATNTKAGVVEEVEQANDPDEIVNRIVPLGGGTGLDALTLQKSTRTSPYTIQTGTNSDGTNFYYLEDSASVTTYGRRPKVIPFPNIIPLSNSDADIANAADALYDAASSYLQWYKDEHTTYSVRGLQVPAAVKVGDKITLIYRGVVTRRGAAYKWVDINSPFYVMERTDDLMQTGTVRTSLALSNLGRRRIDDAEIVIGTLQDVKVMQTFVRPYPSAETFVYKEELAPSHTVSLPIEIDSRVLYLNSTKVRVETRPLRSTVTAAAAGGGTTVSSASGGGQTSSSSGGQTPTSSSGGGQTSSSGGGGDWTSGIATADHRHWQDSVPGFDAYGGNNHQHLVTTSSHSHTVSDHTHTVSVSAHTHTVSDHTHNVTLSNHTHSMTYGIYDDTAYPSTISLSIDGVDRTTALGGPWAAGGGALNTVLDITTYLVNASGGLRQQHTLVFSCTGGLGQIVATIRSLMTTQAIAVA